VKPPTDSLERLVPDELSVDDTTGQETFRIHLERYEFAARHAPPGRLLDVACGVGYGSRLLADRRADVTEVVGVDISEGAVGYASNRYGLPGRVRYVCADGMRLRDERGFDGVVSIETIEHVPHPGGFVRAVDGLLRPGGVFVASVPTTPSVDANPHHLHDFSARSFRRLFRDLGYTEKAAFAQRQPFNPLAIASGREKRLADMRRNLPLYYCTHPGKAWLRAWSTVVHGFCNKYLTVAWVKRG